MVGLAGAPRKIGQILLDGGFVSRAALEGALAEQRRTNELLGQVLVRMQVLDPREIQAVLSIQQQLATPEQAVHLAAGVRQTLGALLLQAGRLDQAQLDRALAEQRRTGEKLGAVLVRLGLLSASQLERALIAQQQQGAGGEASPIRLGELLVAAGTITRAQLDLALRKKRESGKKLGEVLVEEGFAQLRQIAACLKLQQKLMTAVAVAALSLGEAATHPARAEEGWVSVPVAVASDEQPGEQRGEPAGAEAFRIPRGEAAAPAQAAADPAREHKSGCTLGEVDRAKTSAASCTSCHQHGGHPVGMSYAAAAADPRNQLRPQHQLARQVVLGPAGEVTCTTCHDAAAGRKHKTALDSRKMLCLACHDVGTSPVDYAAFPPGQKPNEKVAASFTSKENGGSGTLLAGALTRR